MRRANVETTGTTAIKGNLGLYVQSQGTGYAATYNPIVITTDVRTWNDLNHDDIAQETELGPTGNLNFGVRQNQNPAPGIKRPYQWVYDIAFQHELFRGVGVSVSYNRRNFNQIIWTQNLVAPLSAYSLTSVPSADQYLRRQSGPRHGHFAWSPRSSWYDREILTRMQFDLRASSPRKHGAIRSCTACRSGAGEAQESQGEP